MRLSAANWLEAAIVIDGNHTPALNRRFDRLLREAEVEIEPVTARQAELAREAYRAYGRGRGNSAHLNYGDCFAYALAIEKDEPLLFKGNDFTRTDVRRLGLQKKEDAMNSVFILWHVHEFESGEESSKLIGVYVSEADATAAQNRVKDQPGFSTCPEGFQIDKYEIGKDHWEEGYFTYNNPIDSN